MCGRVAISIPKEDLQNYLYDYFSIEEFNLNRYKPSYNIAPSQNVLAILNDGKQNRAGYLKWGYIPSYAKDEKTTIINTRSETITEKNAFKDSFFQRRMIIPVDSFYEWQKDKTPVRIFLKDKSIFALAAIWNSFQKENGEKIFTFSIITTNANNLIKDIHDRMPVIIPVDKIDNWLNPNNKDIDDLKSMLIPFSEDLMTYYQVSKDINSPKNDYPELIEKVNN